MSEDRIWIQTALMRQDRCHAENQSFSENGRPLKSLDPETDMSLLLFIEHILEAAWELMKDEVENSLMA